MTLESAGEEDYLNQFGGYFSNPGGRDEAKWWRGMQKWRHLKGWNHSV